MTHEFGSISYNREELCKAVKIGDFYRQKGQEKEVASKKWIVSAKVTFCWGTTGVYQVDFLTN